MKIFITSFRQNFDFGAAHRAPGIAAIKDTARRPIPARFTISKSAQSPKCSSTL